EFSFLWKQAGRDERAAAAMEAVHAERKSEYRRGTGAGLCGEIFSTRGEETRSRNGDEPDWRAEGRYPGTELDERRHEEGGAGEAGGVSDQDWVSRQMARLLSADRGQGRLFGECAPRSGV